MEALAILVYPFVACLLLILIHAYFGIHILERGVIFLDLSLAQFIAVGIAFSFLLGDDPSSRFFFALLFALLGAFILSFSRQIACWVNIEAFIGVLYVFSLAASILILDRSPHGAEEFKSLLNGNILWILPQGLLKTAFLYAGIGIFQFLFRKKFIGLSLGTEKGYLWEFLFFLSFALVLVSSVQVAGILQVFSFLVIPALIGKLYTKDFFKTLLAGWGIGFLASILGLVLSYAFDLPTAPLIVASLSLGFFSLLGARILKSPPVSPDDCDPAGGRSGERKIPSPKNSGGSI
jgi:zinc/manganese transport system permease protein